MASLFARAIEHVLAHEGGFADHPSDPGGATNWGISIRALKQLEHNNLMDWDLDEDGDVDADDMRLLTRAQAIELYRKHFWYDALDQLPVVVAIKVFDMGVNMGRRQAGVLLQRALNLSAPIAIDGAIGPKTIAAAAERLSSHFLHDLPAVQAKFYFDLVDKRPARDVFLVGWLRRAYWMPAKQQV